MMMAATKNRFKFFNILREDEVQKKKKSKFCGLLELWYW